MLNSLHQLCMCNYRARTIYSIPNLYQPEDEQPFSRVKLMVEMARKRKGVNGNFDFDESILQTKGLVLAFRMLLMIARYGRQRSH